MKLFAFIMAGLVLYLSCMSCKDDVRHLFADKFASHQNDVHHEDKDDFCPPFCVCACCSVTAIGTSLELTSSLELNGSIHYFDRLAGGIIKIALPVWQPPKLV